MMPTIAQLIAQRRSASGHIYLFPILHRNVRHRKRSFTKGLGTGWVSSLSVIRNVPTMRLGRAANGSASLLDSAGF